MNAQTQERLFDLTRDDDQRMNQDTMQRFATNEIRAVARNADEAGSHAGRLLRQNRRAGAFTAPDPGGTGRRWYGAIPGFKRTECRRPGLG